MANHHAEKAKQLMQTKGRFEFLDSLTSFFGYSIIQNKINKAIQLYTAAISDYYATRDYNNVVECYKEIAHLQAKPVLALETLKSALDVAIIHNWELAGELAESVVARHTYLNNPSILLRFYEVCADWYYQQTLFRECVLVLTQLLMIHQSSPHLCEPIYENIIFIYLTKLNRPNLALTYMDGLLRLSCIAADKHNFYTKFYSASPETLSGLLSKLKYIPIIQIDN